MDDYIVNVTGQIDGDNGQYPEDKVHNLCQFIQYGQSVGVVSSFLADYFNITELVIKSFTLEQKKGG